MRLLLISLFLFFFKKKNFFFEPAVQRRCTAAQNCAKKVLESKVLGSLFFTCLDSVDFHFFRVLKLTFSVRKFPKNGKLIKPPFFRSIKKAVLLIDRKKAVLLFLHMENMHFSICKKNNYGELHIPTI